MIQHSSLEVERKVQTRDPWEDEVIRSVATDLTGLVPHLVGSSVDMKISDEIIVDAIVDDNTPSLTLAAACRLGSLSMARHVLESFNPHDIPRIPHQVLNQAVFSGYCALVYFLLRKGVGSGRLNYTFLAAAAESGSTQMMGYCLKLLNKAVMPGWFYSSSLNYALDARDYKMVDFLSDTVNLSFHVLYYRLEGAEDQDSMIAISRAILKTYPEYFAQVIEILLKLRMMKKPGVQEAIWYVLRNAVDFFKLPFAEGWSLRTFLITQMVLNWGNTRNVEMSEEGANTKMSQGQGRIYPDNPWLALAPFFWQECLPYVQGLINAIMDSNGSTDKAIAGFNPHPFDFVNQEEFAEDYVDPMGNFELLSGWEDETW